MATIPLPPDFSEFLKLLNEHKVRYLLIGDMLLAIMDTYGQQLIWIFGSNETCRMQSG